MADTEHRVRSIRGRQADSGTLQSTAWERLSSVGQVAWTKLCLEFEREMEAGRGFLWSPVLFGAGILLYFALPAEPSLPALLAGAGALWLAGWRSRPRIVAFRLLVALAAILSGLAVMKLRTDLVAAPVLAREMTVTVSGWVTDREAASRGGARVVLRVHRMDRVAADEAPLFVRITIRSGADAISVGDSLSVIARLRPPSGPVIPGGYDFARADYYDSVGAVGFAYGAARKTDLGEPPFVIRVKMPIAHARQAIRERIIATLPGDKGQIAAALIMGDRRGISEGAQEAMRASGLGHILAISGLHMALIAGSAFWLIRALLAISPTLALRYPIRKWAAGGALTIAALYLAISGASVATERAFAMLAVMLLAIMIDRRAITLRNVSLAAMIILLIEPESILTASFQMSFAATLALVAGYEALRDRADRLAGTVNFGVSGPGGRIWQGARGLFLTSLIAGLATTPFAVYHFQRAAPLTLLANLAAMPVVGFLVMPMAFFAVLLMPFGLEAAPLVLMGFGLDWILWVARTTAGWSSDWGGIPAVPAAAILVVVAGFLWLALWRERLRWAGLLPIAVALPIALASPRPDVLVDDGGRVAAVRAADGRYRVINAKENRFAVETWLRADADPRTVNEVVGADIRCDAVGCNAALADGGLVAVSLAQEALSDDCRLSAVVISRLRAPPGCDAAALVIDGPAIAAGGAHAIYRTGDRVDGRETFRIETAYPANRRPFMPPVGQ